MDVFLVTLLKPFAAVLLLLIAWPIKRAVQLWMPDCWLKRFMLKRRGDAVQAWFERVDARINRAALRLIGR